MSVKDLPNCGNKLRASLKCGFSETSYVQIRKSSSEKILLNPLISVLFGPESQGNRRQIVNHRDGLAILGQIDSAKQVIAGFADFETDIRKLLGRVNAELLFAILPAVRAKDAQKAPFLRAERALKKFFSTIAFWPKNTKQGQGITTRAETNGHG